MDFFDSLALPQSYEHLILLKYLLGLTFTLFVPYLTFLIGASFFSIILKKKAVKLNDDKPLRLARDLVNIGSTNKSIVYALGIIPLLSAIFCYIQVLQDSSANVVTLLIAALLTFVIGIVIFFSYKTSFNLKSIFNYIESKNYTIEDAPTKETIEIYKSNADKKYKNEDVWSLVLFLLTAVFFVSAVVLASNTNNWGADFSIISTIFSIKTISYLAYLFALSIVTNSVVALFYYYRIKNPAEVGEDYLNYVRNYTINNALIFSVILPVFIVLNLFFTPEIALSSYAFIAVLFFLGAILLLSSFLYVMQKEKRANYVNILVALLISFFIFSNAKDQLAFSTASKKHLAQLEANFQQYEEDFKSSLGISTVQISGEDIYNGKCIACHRFDSKLVGPPYNSVLPKYEGKEDQLVQFILNPVKIDPDYPSMPNQGLKPYEAKAVAEYLLNTYKQ